MNRIIKTPTKISRPRKTALTACLLLCSLSAWACSAPRTFNPGDPTSEEFYLQRVAAMLLGDLGATASVGGSVSGLVGTLGLTDGTETLTITTDGNFTFAAARALGAAFTVSGSRQPTGQLCEIQNGTGVVSGDSATAVNVSCRTVLYVGGAFGTYNGAAHTGLVRLSESGATDSSFNTGTGFLGATSTVQSVRDAGDGSGDVYVGGDFTTYQGAAANRIARLNADGSADSTFASGSGFDGPVFALAPLNDGTGRVYVGGDFNNYQGVARGKIVRLNPDGSVDETFNPGTGFDMGVRALVLALDGSGDLYVGGDFTTYQGVGGKNRILRLNSDGSEDTGFASSGGNNPVRGIAAAIDGSGAIYVGGEFTNFNSSPANRILRLNSDGSTDGGYTSGTAANGTVNAVAPANDGSGDIYLASNASQYDGNFTFNMVRTNSNGSYDGGLGLSTGFNSETRAVYMAIDGSGTFYMGGGFTNFNGSGANYIISLNSDGSVNTTFNFGTGFDADVITIGH